MGMNHRLDMQSAEIRIPILPNLNHHQVLFTQTVVFGLCMSLFWANFRVSVAGALVGVRPELPKHRAELLRGPAKSDPQRGPCDPSCLGCSWAYSIVIAPTSQDISLSVPHGYPWQVKHHGHCCAMVRDLFVISGPFLSHSQWSSSLLQQYQSHPIDIKYPQNPASK